MALTKHAIAEQIRSGPGFSKNRSVKITENLLEIIKSTLGSAEDVVVSGFGKFCVREKIADHAPSCLGGLTTWIHTVID